LVFHSSTNETLLHFHVYSGLIDLPVDKDQWQAVVNTGMHLQAP